ncbi:extracellular solute-binding protein [Halorussus amylolyticus]|uniref:extracellular solute-binding protein n=1 Tax=Halorussus amylolyticus TaxID=1126242 RepID=UPI00104449FA|nr:extracellular solute-binding protein [Halorussus amylolyticus]
MALDRRKLLKQIGGAGTIATLAGCASVQESSQDTTESGGDSGGGDSDGSESDGSDESDDTESQGPSGTATVWYSLSDTEKALREDIMQTFNDESHHTVDGSDISEMQDKTTSSIPAGQGPEIFQWAHDWVGDYYEREFVVDGSDQLSVELDQFSDAAANAVQYDDAVVGLPFSAETVTLIYNADIVDEAPETFADMEAAMEDYHDPDSGQYGLAYPFDPYFVSGFAQAFGGYYFDPEKDPALGLEADETIQGLEFAVDNLTPYMPNDPGYEPQEAAFMEGNAAFAISGPWYLAGLNDNDINYELMTFPEIDGGQFRPYTGIKMWYFSKAMEEDGADAAAAMEFAEWFVTNEDHLLSRAEDQGHIPVLADLVGSDELPSAVQVYSEAVDQGVPMPTDPRMNDVWAALEEPMVQVFNGSQSPEEALTGAAEEVRSNWE